MELIKLNCPNCGGTLDITPEHETIFCQYCGSKILVKRDASAIQLELLDKRVAKAEALPILIKFQDIYEKHDGLFPYDEFESYESTFRNLLNSNNRRVAQVTANAIAGVLVWDLEIEEGDRKDEEKDGVSWAAGCIGCFGLIISFFGCFYIFMETFETFQLREALSFILSSIIVIILMKIIFFRDKNKEKKNKVKSKLELKIDKFNSAKDKFRNIDLSSYLNGNDDKILNALYNDVACIPHLQNKRRYFSGVSPSSAKQRN